MLKKAASGVLASPRVCEAYLVKRHSFAKYEQRGTSKLPARRTARLGLRRAQSSLAQGRADEKRGLLSSLHDAHVSISDVLPATV